MSETPPEPRRSQRDRKQAKPVTTVIPTATRKRKRNHSDVESEDERVNTEPESALSGDEADEEENLANADDGEDYRVPKTNGASTKRRGRPKATTDGAKRAPSAKKPRTQRTAERKSAKPGARKGRKPKTGDASFDAEKVAKNTKINTDNPLFNAVINPAAALQSTAEDFLEALHQDPGSAQAELINFILRSCGCNDSVDGDEVLNYDGVVDTLDDFTEGLKADESPTYPLTSKLPLFKKFRSHLSEFLTRLVASAADLQSLYNTDLVSTLQVWVIAMSSSQIRSFRHTATAVALEVEGALCSVAKGIEKEKEMVSRQIEGEKKRRTGKTASPREKELEKKMKEVRRREAKVAEYLGEIIDGVFVHRYRDTDPFIRTDCITSLGKYFKTYTSHFLSNTYLRYLGWVLSDQNTTVRLSAVKTLQIVYGLSSDSAEASLAAPLNQFTERFKSRLLDMAEGDIEVGVRVGVLSVLQHIDEAGLLSEEDRDRLGSLVYSEELKVRRGVAAFVRGVWDEWVEEQMMEIDGTVSSKTKGRLKKGKEKSDDTRTKVGIKGIAMLLVKWGKALDHADADEPGERDEEGQGDESSPNGVTKRSLQIAALSNASSPEATAKSRVTLAVEALWDEVDCVDDWENILAMLLLDHTAANGDPSSSRRRSSKKAVNGRRKKTGASDNEDDDEDATSSQVEDAWRLDEDEESVLLEILVASLHRAKDMANSKKGEDEATANDITRALIEALPRFFIKYQTDANRISHVLALPTLMSLDLYLEMRMTPNYANLWDDAIKQFTTHTSPTVLSAACNAMIRLNSVTSLSNTNESKVLELEEELSSTLRDLVTSKDEIEVSTFSEDDVNTLGSICLRIRLLTGMRNMTAWIDENEGGKQSSLWDILLALIERGRLGYLEEEMMIEQAQHILTLHILWKGLSFSNGNADTPGPDDTFLSQRETLLEKLTDYAIGTQSNAVAGVRRVAFKNLLDLHIYFSVTSPSDIDEERTPTSALALTMDDEVQFRCAGFVQAEMERYADAIHQNIHTNGNGKEHNNNDEDSETEDTPEPNDLEPDEATDLDSTSRERLTEEYSFLDVILTFLRAIKTSTIHVRHSSTLLSNFGRLGASYDSCAKVVVEILREEGLVNGDVSTLELVIVEAVKEAFSLRLGGSVKNETQATDLAKTLSHCFVLRRSQLSVIRRLDTQHIVQIQVDLLNWLGRQLGQHQKSSNRKSLRKVASFFRVLVPLLSHLHSRDALQIKAHLDQVLAQAKVDATSTLKIWEPLRAYQKRLGAIMAKEKSKSRKSKGKGADAALVTTDEESEVEKIVDDAIQPDTDAGEESEVPPPPGRQEGADGAPDKGANEEASATVPTEDTSATPRNSRKRPHASMNGDGDDNIGSPEADGTEREATPPGDIIVRRKRIRR